MMKFKKLSVMVLSFGLLASGPSFAALAAGGKLPPSINGTSYIPSPSQVQPQGTSAQERKAQKSNSAECRSKTEANQRERDEDSAKESRDASRGHLNHDSHAETRKADTRHDDMVRADHDREATNENERKQVCGEIDDGKLKDGEHDDKERQAQHDRENKNAENQQRR